MLHIESHRGGWDPQDQEKEIGFPELGLAAQELIADCEERLLQSREFLQSLTRDYFDNKPGAIAEFTRSGTIYSKKPVAYSKDNANITIKCQVRDEKRMEGDRRIRELQIMRDPLLGNEDLYENCTIQEVYTLATKGDQEEILTLSTGIFTHSEFRGLIKKPREIEKIRQVIKKL